MDLIDKVGHTVSSYRSVNDLKSGVISGSYTQSNPDFSRCFLWKTIFILQTLDVKEWGKQFEASRATYKFLSKQYQPPFCLLEPDNPYYEKPKVELVLHEQIDELNIDNKPKNLNKKTSLFGKTSLSLISSKSGPLSSSSLEHSPNSLSKKASISTNGDLTTSELDINELESIIIDMERTFPGLPIFKDIKVKKNIVKILFVWYKLNQDLGYRQGMHEIVSLIYLINHTESFQRPTNGFDSETDEIIFEIFNQEEILADAFQMFTIFMINPQSSYYNEQHLIENSGKFDALLKDFDYDLYCYFNKSLKLESQIWLIRWLRLLFIRELTLTTVLPIWDKLISFQQIKDFSNLTSNNDFNVIMSTLVLVLLLHIKTELLLDCQDYGDTLKLLLNYPIKKVFDDESLSKKFDEDFSLDEAEVKESSIEFINQLFNDAILIFNSRRNLRFIGKFFNEKYNKDLIDQVDPNRVKGPSFVLDENILDNLRFQNRLKKRVKKALRE